MTVTLMPGLISEALRPAVGWQQVEAGPRLHPEKTGYGFPFLLQMEREPENLKDKMDLMMG